MSTDTKPRFLELLLQSGLSGSDDTRPYLAPGYQAQSDVLVDESADGVPLSELWNEFNYILQEWNSHRLALISLLAYGTISVGDVIPQSISSESFEESGEYSIAKAIGQDPALVLGNKFVDWDLRQAWTWRFLRDAPAEQIRDSFNRGLEADIKLQTGLVLGRLFDNTTDLNEHGHVVYSLFNGSGPAPLPYLGKAFPANHSHYFGTSATILDSLDIEDAYRLIHEHGFGRTVGSQLLILANPVQGELIQSWRGGEESRPGGPKAKYSFIPSAGAPAYLEPSNIVGAVAPSAINGQRVSGSYGPGWLVESDLIPEGYVCVVASGGVNSPNSPIALRSHPKIQYQGLRFIPGHQQGYPLIDAHLVHGIGCGTRHRGAAVCMQVVNSTTYTPPVIPR